MALSVISNNLFYMSGAKQAAWGTENTMPGWSHRWLQGSGPIDGAQMQSEREGDTSPYISAAWKSGQYWGFKIVEYPHPQIAGYCLQALFGAGSDTYTAPTQTGTLDAAVSAGDAIFSTVTDLGTTGMLALDVDPGYSNNLYEVVTVDLTTQSGAGPFTYTLANSGTFKNAHAMGATIDTGASHKFTRQHVYDAYSYELGYGLTASAIKGAFRYVDAVCTDITMTGAKGRKWRFESTWIAASAKLLSAVSTPTYEGSNTVGKAGGPFVWYQGNTWLLNGANTGNAATIEGVQLMVKNSGAWDDLQNEALNATYFLPGNMDVSGNVTVQFQSWEQYYDMYFGSTTAPNNSIDSYLVGYESLDLVCAQDAINSLEINLPRIYYTAAKIDPALDGKAFRQPLSFTALKPEPGASPSDAIVVTLGNSLASQY